MARKLFFVKFNHMDTLPPGYERPFEAESVAALEPEIQAFVDQRLGDGKVVTIIPALMRGQVDYGLKGEFTISDGSDG